MEKNSFDGQKVYTKTLLKLYNFIVLFFNNRFLWKCNTSNLLEQFEDNVSKNHLDIGIGSGFFLKKVDNKLDKVSLMDLNSNCLNYVSNLLKDKNVKCYQQDILKNVNPKLNDRFDSISCNYLIHCLPNNGNKETVFKNIAAMLKPDGIAFGSTIINEYSNSLAKKVAKKFNNKGIFDNSEDSYELIEIYLKNNFQKYSMKRIGSVCLFNMSSPIK